MPVLLTSGSQKTRPICCQIQLFLKVLTTYPGKRRIDSSYDIRLYIRIEEVQEVWRLDDNGHHTGVVSKQETAIGSKHCQKNVEQKTHLFY